MERVCRPPGHGAPSVFIHNVKEACEVSGQVERWDSIGQNWVATDFPSSLFDVRRCGRYSAYRVFRKREDGGGCATRFARWVAKRAQEAACETERSKVTHGSRTTPPPLVAWFIASLAPDNLWLHWKLITGDRSYVTYAPWANGGFVMVNSGMVSGSFRFRRRVRRALRNTQGRGPFNSDATALLRHRNM